MTLSPTPRSTIRRNRDRGRTDRAELHAVLDAGLICHFAVQIDGAPRVLPMGYGRIGETLFLHGSTGARPLRSALEGVDACACVTLVDGIVYGRSMMHLSMNYRSAVIHGRTRAVTDPDERWAGLRAITDHLAPGSWEHARQPTKQELAATALVAIDLWEASVKVRTGPPVDDDEDVAAATAWAGVLPLRTSWGEPEPCPLLPADFPAPEHVTVRKAP
jgi:nitroimidazol reductase NimA-like FMN-containing flavoprotein (pyridoxamine 5'-phosphate oxidase superfamily)